MPHHQLPNRLFRSLPGFSDTWHNPLTHQHPAGLQSQEGTKAAKQHRASLSLCHAPWVILYMFYSFSTKKAGVAQFPLWFISVLTHHSTEYNPQTCLVYLYCCEHIGADSSCAFGSEVVHDLSSTIESFGTCLTVETETSGDSATKSYWSSFGVNWGILNTCLLYCLVMAVDGFFCVPPGGALKVPSTLNYEILLHSSCRNIKGLESLCILLLIFSENFRHYTSLGIYLTCNEMTLSIFQVLKVFCVKHISTTGDLFVFPQITTDFEMCALKVNS